MEMAYRDWFEDSPGWEASGRSIELLLEDGTAATGILAADEFFTGADEIPVFTVLTRDGRAISPFDAAGYRFLDHS
jgi:hypothetical protein